MACARVFPALKALSAGFAIAGGAVDQLASRLPDMSPEREVVLKVFT
jgi:hypothetical protein